MDATARLQAIGPYLKQCFALDNPGFGCLVSRFTGQFDVTIGCLAQSLVGRAGLRVSRLVHEYQDLVGAGKALPGGQWALTTDRSKIDCRA